MRLLVALVVWAGAVVAVAELTRLADDYARGGLKPAPAAAAPAPQASSDVSRELPPRPGALVPATARDSLFARRNLEAVLRRVTGRFGASADVVGFALYPGEADFVIARGGGARVVRAQAGGRPLQVEARQDFAGSREAILLGQLQAVPLIRFLRFVVDRAPLPLDAISRVVLDTTSRKNLAGYRIQTQSGVTSYTTLLTGGPVTALTPGGPRQLR